MISPERRVETIIRVVRPRAGDPSEEAADGVRSEIMNQKVNETVPVHFKVQAISLATQHYGLSFTLTGIIRLAGAPPVESDVNRPNSILCIVSLYVRKGRHCLDSFWTRSDAAAHAGFS